MSFYDVAVKFEKMIYFHIRDLHMKQPYDDCFQDGLFALWQAYQTFDPQKGELSTYVSSKVHNKLLNVKTQEPNRVYKNMLFRQTLVNQSITSHMKPVDESYSWERIQDKMTVNRWKWVYHYIIL